MGKARMRHSELAGDASLAEALGIPFLQVLDGGKERFASVDHRARFAQPMGEIEKLGRRHDREPFAHAPLTEAVADLPDPRRLHPSAQEWAKPRRKIGIDSGLRQQ